MATPGEKLAESLQALKELQDKDNCLVIYGTTQLSRTHRDRLKLNGWLQEVLKGWYIVSKPGAEGDTTVWYSSFWNFIKAYWNRKYYSDYSCVGTGYLHTSKSGILHLDAAQTMYPYSL